MHVCTTWGYQARRQEGFMQSIMRGLRPRTAACHGTARRSRNVILTEVLSNHSSRRHSYDPLWLFMTATGRKNTRRGKERTRTKRRKEPLGRGSGVVKSGAVLIFCWIVEYVQSVGQSSTEYLREHVGRSTVGS